MHGAYGQPSSADLASVIHPVSRADLNTLCGFGDGYPGLPDVEALIESFILHLVHSIWGHIPL